MYYNYNHKNAIYIKFENKKDNKAGCLSPQCPQTPRAETSKFSTAQAASTQIYRCIEFRGQVHSAQCLAQREPEFSNNRVHLDRASEHGTAFVISFHPSATLGSIQSSHFYWQFAYKETEATEM